MKKIPILEKKDLLDALQNKQNPFFSDYFAFYSSWYGGIITSLQLMLLPMDDHLVHRGDGVFEALKAVDRGIYLFDEHMVRLKHSADMVQLPLPYSLDEMKEIIIATLRVANKNNATVRIFVSRGPGNFSVNPYDSVGSQFYVIVGELKSPAPEKYEHGVTVCQSTVPVKNGWMAVVKSCNYLPNVMMKKEAIDRGFDFSINLDAHGFVAEGATENIIIVNSAGTIVHPEFDHILKGTTMLRIAELAAKENIRTEMKRISLSDLQSAKEIMMCGTTLNVLPVTRFENQQIGDGAPGALAKKLNRLLLDDMRTGSRRTIF